jgi:serine/threonine protein kinase
MVPHISDFGIAKLMDQPSTASQTTGIVGTIGYMAPGIVETKHIITVSFSTLACIH